MKLFSIVVFFALLFIQNSGIQEKISITDEYSNEYALLEFSDDNFHIELNADDIDELLFKFIILNKEIKHFVKAECLNRFIPFLFEHRSQLLRLSSDLSPPVLT